MEVYQPAEDSYFFVEFLKGFLKTHKVSSYLDMGTGSGVLSVAVAEFIDKKNITAADINSSSVKFVGKKGFLSVESNLFEKINGSYDLITFNAPYLPIDGREPVSSRVATTGGKCGDEISVKFLKQARKFLNKNGTILLLISSLTPLDKIKKFEMKIVARKKIFMEELIILEFNQQQ